MFGRRGKADQAAGDVRAAWAGLRADLDAVAAQPADGGTWVQLALRWTELATLAPTHRVRPGDHLLGFSARADGRLQDAALTERALALIDQLLAAGHDPVRLLQARAHLLTGWQRYEEASVALDTAAQYVPAEHPEAAQAAGLLRHHAAMLRAQIGNRSPATDEEIAQLAELARAIAGSVQRIVSYAPPVVWLHPLEAPPEPPEARLIYLGAQLRLDGFQQLGWIENSWFNALFEQRVLTAAWAPPQADLVVAGGVVRGVEAIDVETWLSDGRFVTTTASRGRNGFSGGAWEDSLQVDTAIPIDELIALHRARVRLLLATTPGLSIWPVSSAPAFAEMQEALRQRKAEFRLAEGLSESEARGIVPGHPELAVPLFRQEAQRACAAAAHAQAHAAAA